LLLLLLLLLLLQIAKWLGAPVVLVVDCWAMARSVAALVKGYTEFDQDLTVKGLLLNKVGSSAHGMWLKEALAAAAQQQQQQQRGNAPGLAAVQVLGCIPKVGG
jgi:cobyrinic acid a,c-diamide synthase